MGSGGLHLPRRLWFGRPEVGFTLLGGLKPFFIMMCRLFVEIFGGMEAQGEIRQKSEEHGSVHGSFKVVARLWLCDHVVTCSS